jgi:endonuclease/exonuclease/phosphatase family metal-dependent hydrolase
MVTISVKQSAKQVCVPSTVNRLLKKARTEDAKLKKLFWPRLVMDKSINNGRKVGAKVDEENRKYLRDLKQYIRDKFGIFVTYSMLICVLIKVVGRSKERKLMSLNVKGYRTKTAEFKRCLKGIAEQVRKVFPDILFLQEFRIGEDDMFINTLLKELGQYYRPVYPANYIKDTDYNNCICITLAGKHIDDVRIKHLKNEGAGFKHRYNFVEAEDYTYLNTWAPQIFNGKQDRIELSDKMWKDILNIAGHYRKSEDKFILAGDLNAFINGESEQQILKMSYLLHDTKTDMDIDRPTGPVNTLDYVFANQRAITNAQISTEILTPSIRQLGLSDHEALVTTIREIPKE